MIAGALREPRDAAVLGAALAHGAVAAGSLAAVAAPGTALGARAAVALALAALMAWASNTVSHVHLHRPLFRRAAANRAFSLYLCALLMVPQGAWAARHLRHHGLAAPAGVSPRLGLELAALLAVPAALLLAAPALAAVWLLAAAAGYGLGALQGHGEHAADPRGVDHRGRLYNLLWFNDGFHAAHHRAPAAHWTDLPRHARPDDARSGWPPALRAFAALAASAAAAASVAPATLVAAALDRLERAALRSPRVQRLLLATHQRAFRALLPALALGPAPRIAIIGGGLFPRTALVLARLIPGARLTLIDRAAAHLAEAARILARRTPRLDVRFVCDTFDPASPPPCDLLIVPLAFRGDRGALRATAAAPRVLVHDWLWRRAPRSVPVSWLLAKRLVLLEERREDGIDGKGSCEDICRMFGRRSIPAGCVAPRRNTSSITRRALPAGRLDAPTCNIYPCAGPNLGEGSARPPLGFLASRTLR